MKKEIENKEKVSIQRGLNVLSPIASGLALIHPAFLAIPVITSVTNELCSYFDAISVEKRLLEFQKKIEEYSITIKELENRIDLLSEHSQYVFRNNVKYLCLNALPETAETLIDCLISYLINDKQEMDEEICEIICACNANDIKLLRIIKHYLRDGERTHYQEMVKAHQKDVEEKIMGIEDKATKATTNGYVPQKWYDRNVIYGSDTIFWSDFTKFCNLKNVHDMGIILNEAGMREDGVEVYEWAFLMRSLLKLQSKGVIQLEFRSSLGTISQNNVDRFHVTLFGQNLLQHIKLNEKDNA